MPDRIGADPLSHGLWARTAPPAPEAPPLAGEARADVAVVGAGFTGLSAALHLAEAGARVTVLDAAEPGFGGAGRNVGLVNAGLWLPPDEVVAILGAETGERLLEVLGRAPDLVFELIARHGIACEAVRAGTLHCAVGEAGLRAIEARAAQWARRGAPVRVLGREEAASATGAQGFTGALHDARAGTIQPLAYARGLARAAIAAGAVLHAGTRVEGYEAAGSGWRLLVPGGALVADWVVVATQAWSGPPWEELRTNFTPLPYFQVATRPLGHNLRASILPGLEGAWDTRQVMTSFRMDAAGRLVFGSVGALEGSAHATHRAWAIRKIRRVFPQLEEVEPEAEWHGRIAMTEGHVPRFHLLRPRMVAVHGYNGRGIAPGTMFGKLLAEHVLGGADPIPLPAEAPRPVGFRAARAAFYARGAQAAHLLDARS